MGRDDEIDAIVAHGRRTRRPTPRWLWIASLALGVICLIAFAAVMLGERGPARSPQRIDRTDHTDTAGAGGRLGIGLVIGLGAGIVIGFSIGRQRRSHSSRNSP
jgi:hypothetical protein